MFSGSAAWTRGGETQAVHPELIRLRRADGWEKINEWSRPEATSIFRFLARVVNKGLEIQNPDSRVSNKRKETGHYERNPSLPLKITLAPAAWDLAEHGAPSQWDPSGTKISAPLLWLFAGVDWRPISFFILPGWLKCGDQPSGFISSQ